MKKLLLGLFFIAGVAHAEYWTSPTERGGEIVLTTTKVANTSTNKSCRGMSIAYVVTSSQTVIYGCWFVSQDKIHVIYNDGSNLVYPKDNWLYHGEQ
jgi:hypothetical protein